MEKLTAREAEFKETERLKKKNKRDRRAARKAKAESAESSDEDESESEEDSEDEQANHQRRAAKLEALRDEVEDAKLSVVNEEVKEEEMREQFLTANENDISVPMLKRKRRAAQQQEGKKEDADKHDEDVDTASRLLGEARIETMERKDSVSHVPRRDALGTTVRTLRPQRWRPCSRIGKF